MIYFEMEFAIHNSEKQEAFMMKVSLFGVNMEAFTRNMQCTTEHFQLENILTLNARNIYSIAVVNSDTQIF